MPIRFPHHGRVRMLAVLLAASVLCAGLTCHKTKPPPPVPVPPLGAVAILPATVYSAAGSAFEWRAVVTTPGNRIIDVDGYEEITIKWSSTKATTLFPDPTKNPVIAQVPDTPGLTIDDVMVTVTREISPADRTSVTSTTMGRIRIASASTPATDRIIADHIANAPPVAVLLDAKTSSECPMNDWAIAVVGTADLEYNLDAGCSPAPELVAWSVGREVEFRDENASFKWSPANDIEQVRPPMPAFRSISVVIGVPTSSELIWASAEIDNVNTLFDANQSGIGIAAAKTFVHARTAGISDLDAACTTPALNGLLLPGSHTMGDPDLFVLFVTDLKDKEGNTELVYQGYTCPESSDQTGRVVYLSINAYLHTTLAHELGHIFGLNASRIPFGGGHSNSIGSFLQDNLMYNTTDPEIRFNRNRFSIGQIFRMNFDIGSWLNSGGLDPSVVRMRTCQTHTGADVCPAIDKEPG